MDGPNLLWTRKLSGKPVPSTFFLIAPCQNSLDRKKTKLERSVSGWNDQMQIKHKLIKLPREAYLGVRVFAYLQSSRLNWPVHHRFVDCHYVKLKGEEIQLYTYLSIETNKSWTLDAISMQNFISLDTKLIWTHTIIISQNKIKTSYI